ncbi:MAG: hypothetical protein GY814_05990 [Gammaproteobacteria bacterium]|nr:hypothetical protein [Gammaproteobacteria bacterium]
MPNNSSSLDLLVPGLLGPLPSLRELNILPSAPIVERCLSRARVSSLPATDYPATIFSRFGLFHEQGADLPTAAFCRLADGAQDANGFWMQASPVHLRPDGDGLLLFDADLLEISRDEANQLADLFRQHFTAMPWQLELYTPQRWYLHLEQQPDLHTAPLADVTGRNIDSFLPQGGDSTGWHSILNEVQMLFHTAQVNMLREGCGQLSINGLWLHGGGYLSPMEQQRYAAVFADEPLVRGMALAAGLEPVALPKSSGELGLNQGRSLVVADLLQRPILDADPVGWLESLERFDAWLEPLLTEVRAKRLGHFNLYPCNGSVYRVDAAALRRFWRSRPGMGKYLG